MLEVCEIVRCDGGSGGGGVSTSTGEPISLKRGFFLVFLLLHVDVVVRP